MEATSRPSPTWMTGGIVLAIVVLLVAIIAVAAQGEQPLAEDGELEDGWVPVADHDGKRAGFVTEEAFNGGLPHPDELHAYSEEYEAEHGKPPPLSIYPPPGEEDPPVYDTSGERGVGYVVPILGFMSIEEYETFDFAQFFEHPKVLEHIARTTQLEEDRARGSDGG